MRVFLILVALAGGILAFWWISQQDPEKERTRLQAQTKLISARIGVQKMLESSDRFGFSNIVITPASDGKPVEFRAMAIQQGTPRPAFGEASANCEDTLEAAECWTITLLEIDGRPYPLTPLRTEAEPVETDLAPSTENALVNIEVGTPGTIDEGSNDRSGAEQTSLTTETPVQTTTESAEQITTDTPSDGAGPAATHQVDRPRINARSGPSTSTAILTTLDAGTRLAQIEENNGWAQFLVLDGPASGQTVWVALSIVAPIAP